MARDMARRLRALDSWSATEPFWRTCPATSTSEMCNKIEAFIARYEGLPCEDKEWLKQALGEETSVRFVFSANKHELEGLDSLDETRRFLMQPPTQPTEGDIKAEVTLAVYTALRSWLSPEGGDRDSPPHPLTLAKVLDTHKSLVACFKDVAGGRLRKASACTRTSGGVHTYTNVRYVRQEVETLIQAAEELIHKFAGEGKPVEVVKVAAHFFLLFEEIHPFEDGNGRMGKILLAYLLRSVMPFPNLLLVRREGDSEAAFVDRDVYLKCFENAQIDSPERIDPGDVVALVIEGVYHQWSQLFDALDKKRAAMLLDNEP